MKQVEKEAMVKLTLLLHSYEIAHGTDLVYATFCGGMLESFSKMPEHVRRHRCDYMIKAFEAVRDGQPHQFMEQKRRTI